MSTQVDTQAIPRVTDVNVADSKVGADACPDESCDRFYADAMESLTVLHEGWLKALAKLGVQETGPEKAAA